MAFAIGKTQSPFVESPMFTFNSNADKSCDTIGLTKGKNIVEPPSCDNKKKLNENYYEYGEWSDLDMVDFSPFYEMVSQYFTHDSSYSDTIQVQRRFSLNDSTIYQLKFKNAFNEYDLIGLVDEGSRRIDFSYQETGITAPEGNTFETLQFYGYGGYQDGEITLGYIWLLYNESYGYNLSYGEKYFIIIPGKWGEWKKFGTTRLCDSDSRTLKDFFKKMGNPEEMWPDTIEVFKRNNLTFPGREEVGFKNLLPGSFISQWTNTYRPQPYISTTSLIYDGSYGDKWPHYVTAAMPVWFYYNDVGMFNIAVILTNDDWNSINNNYYWTSFNFKLTMDGHQQYKLDLPNKFFVASTQKELVIEPSFSGDVHEWRLFKLYNDNDDIQLLDRFLLGDSTAADSLDWEYLKESMTIDCTNLPTTTTLRITPLNKDRRLCAPRLDSYIYRNVPVEGEWESIGQCKVGDYIGYLAARKSIYNSYDSIVSPIVEHMVEIERRKDNPNIYRIANFFHNHPFAGEYNYYDRLIDTDDTFYIVIDATDPSRVRIEERLCGLGDSWRFSLLNFIVNISIEIGEDPEQIKHGWGKNINGRIEFYMGTIGIDNRYLLSVPGQITPEFYIELPGYVDYTFDVDENSKLIENIPAYVSSIDMALIPEVEYEEYFPEVQSQRVIDRDPALNIVNVPTNGSSTVNIPIDALAGQNSRSGDALPSGYYRIVAVPIDTDGNPHIGTVSSNNIYYKAPSNFKLLGDASIFDGAITVFFSYNGNRDGITYKAPIYEDVTRPGFYMIENSHKELAELGEFDYTPHNMYIDATNPRQVNLVATPEGDNFEDPMGYDTGIYYPGSSYGNIYLNSVWNVVKGNPEEECGKKEGNIIQFSQDQMCTGFSNDGSLYYINSFTITLPIVTDTDIICSDESNLPVEWYNLNGIKIERENATPGIYIRRQGSQVTKVYVR